MDGLEENPVSHKETGFCVCGSRCWVLCHTIDDNGIWANWPDNKLLD